MIALTFLNHYAPIWLLVALIALIYIGLKATTLMPNDWVNILTSVVLSFMLVSSDSIVKFMLSVIPYLTLILAVSFFAILILVFVTKDAAFLKNLKPTFAYIIVALTLAIILVSIFGSFPTAYHLLPNTSNSGLDNGVIELKNYIYSTNFKEGLIFIGSIALVCFFILKTK